MYEQIYPISMNHIIRLSSAYAFIYTIFKFDDNFSLIVRNMIIPKMAQNYLSLFLSMIIMILSLIYKRLLIYS